MSLIWFHRPVEGQKWKTLPMALKQIHRPARGSLQ